MFLLKFRTEMATLGPINNMDMSEKIYQDLMKLGSISRQANSKRITSANTTSTKSSYHASQCSSTISKTWKGSIQGSYTDFDIVKSKSWSGSKGRGNQFPLNSSFHKLRQSKKTSETFSLHNQITDRDLISNHSASSLHGKGHSKAANNHCPDNSSQVIRLQQEWAALDHCRAVKRASEMVQHRLDPMYCLSGSNVPLFERYHIDEAELENLRKISAAGHRQLADSRRRLYPHQTRTITPRKIVESKKSNESSSRGLQKTSESPSADSQADHDIEKKATLSASPRDADADLEMGHPSSPVGTPDDTPREAEQSDDLVGGYYDKHTAAGNAGGADGEIDDGQVKDNDDIDGDNR